MRTSKRNRVAKPKLQYLPEDVIVEILSRLPVKSLMQSKTVCRQWKSLITDKNFHLYNEDRRREKPLFFLRGNKHQEERLSYYYSLNQDLRVEEFYNPFSECEFLGSCNGLMLFCYGQDIYLWNPSIKFLRTVHNITSGGQGQGYRRILASGFCYDDAIDDYKLILIIYLTKGIFAFVSHLKSVTWTKIDCPFKVIRMDSVPPIVSRNLHVIAEEDDGRELVRKLIVYFDMKRDEFKLLPKPDTKPDTKDIVCGLGVIEECLCMVRPDRDCKEILIMKEYGVKESWMIMFSILNFRLNNPNDSRYSLVPMFLTIRGEVLMVENHYKVLAYDLNMMSLCVVGLPEDLPSSERMFGLAYTESVTDGNQARPLRKKRSNQMGDFIYFSYLDLL